MAPPSVAFDEAIAITLSFEGGYVNQPQSNYGLSAVEYPDLNLSTLTKEDATEIYRRDYWQRCCCDDLQEGVAQLLFDAAVDRGCAAAIRVLQKVAGVPQDGVVGTATEEASNAQQLDMILHLAAALCEGQSVGTIGRVLTMYKVASQKDTPVAPIAEPPVDPAPLDQPVTP